MQAFSSLFTDKPTSPMPESLWFHCPEGIHPDLPPLWALGKWRKQACSCATEERLRKEQEEKQTELEKAFIPLCYNWMGYDNSKLSTQTFETFSRSKNPQAYDTCLQFARNFKRGKLQNLLLVGSNGVGKTHLAVAILNMLRKEGISGRFAVASELLDAILGNKGGEIDYQKVASQTPLLVIDDLAQVQDTPGREAIFNIILNARYNHDLPTIITMNHLERLSAHIGAAAASRLKVGMIPIMLLGEDQRKYQGR